MVTLSGKPLVKLLKLSRHHALPLSIFAVLAFLLFFWRNLMVQQAFHRVRPWAPNATLLGTVPATPEAWAARQSTTLAKPT